MRQAKRFTITLFIVLICMLLVMFMVRLVDADAVGASMIGAIFGWTFGAILVYIWCKWIMTDEYARH